LIVAEYINRNPDQISSCTLIAPDGSETKFTVREKLLSNRAVGPLLFKIVGRRSLLSRIPRYAGSEDVRHFVRELLEFSLTASGFSTAVRSTVRTFPLHSGEQLYAALARSNIPVLVVWGARDRITPPVAADTMRSFYGHDSVKVMGDVGHLPFVEEPETVANLIYHHVYSSVS
jgi:pimeloyl-ACP methyl ester carboxylesterase